MSDPQVTLSATGEVKEAKVVDLMAKEADEGLMPGPAGYVPTSGPGSAPEPAQALPYVVEDEGGCTGCAATPKACHELGCDTAKEEKKADAPKQLDFASLARTLVFGA